MNEGTQTTFTVAPPTWQGVPGEPCYSCRKPLAIRPERVAELRASAEHRGRTHLLLCVDCARQGVERLDSN